MNVIEALVVTLGLDLTDFDKNDRRVNDALKKFSENADKRTKAFEAAGKRAAETFSSLKTEILGAVAAFAGIKGLDEFVQGTTNTQAALGRLATNTNTSASTLRAWGIVADEVGAKAEDAYGAFDRVNQQLAQAAVTGSSPLLVLMRRLGITDVTNKSSLEDVLLKFSARLQQLPRNQAQYAANEAGLGGIFNELMLGPVELKKRLDEAMKTLPETFNESTKRAQEMQRQLALVRAEFTGLKDRIWNELEPAMFGFFQGIYQWMSQIDWGAVAKWIANLVPAVQSLWHEIENLNDKSGGWLKTLGLLAGAWIALNAVLAASPIGAVLLLAGAIVALWNDYQVFEKGGKSLINWKAWEPDIAAAINGIKTLQGWIDKLYNTLNAADRSVGRFFARKAMEIKAGATPEAKRQQGSDADKLYRYLAAAEGINPDTGEVLPDALQDAGNGTSATPSSPTAGGQNASGAPNGAVSDALLDRVAAVESSSNPNSPDSPKGAVGEYQIEPATGRDYGASEADLRDPVKARQVAARYITDLLKEFHGNLQLAMAAYNWGPGNVEKYGLTNLPAETRAYLAKLNLPVGGAPGQALGALGSASAGQPGDGAPSVGQIGPIIIQVPPGADAQRIAAQIQQSMRQVNLPQALNTRSE